MAYPNDQISMADTDLESTIAEALTDQDVRVSSLEHTLRMQAARMFKRRAGTLGYSVRDLARLTGFTQKKIGVILGHNAGGNVTLRDIARVADVLGLNPLIEFSISEAIL